MANRIDPDLTPAQEATLIAKTFLEDAFTERALKSFAFLSKDIIPYLTDYFLLINDMRSTLHEEDRGCYYDYSFIVVPVHKAFESYLSSVLSLVFDFKITREKEDGHTVGHFLKYDLSQKNTVLTKLSTYTWGKSISKDKWIERWEGLKKEWNTNRNPLTHPDEGNIPKLRQAEQIAGSIFREMEVSIKLFDEEFLTPLVKWYQENQRKKQLAEAIKALEPPKAEV